MDDGRRYTEDRTRVCRVKQKNKYGGHAQTDPQSRRRERNRHQYVRSSREPKEHTQQQGRKDEKERKSMANSRQEKRKANSRQEKSIVNRRQKNKKTCEKPKAEREEHTKDTEDVHIQHQVNEEYTKSTLKTENRRNRTSP